VPFDTRRARTQRAPTRPATPELTDLELLADVVIHNEFSEDARGRIASAKSCTGEG